MRVSVAVLTALAVLVLAAGIAQAYTVTHTPTGPGTPEVLFSDDLEGPYFQAEVGSWGTTNDLSDPEVPVPLAYTKMKTGVTSGGPSAAADGSDYMEMSRLDYYPPVPAPPYRARWQEAIFTHPVSSGTLDIAFQYWINYDNPEILGLDDRVGQGPSLTLGVAAILNKAGVSNWHDWINGDTGCPILLGQWNLAEMHVDLDTDEYQLSINGVPGNLMTGIPDQTISRVGYQFHHTDPSPLPVYLDAAPGTPPPPTPVGDFLLCTDDTYIENLAPETSFGDADSVVVKSWGDMTAVQRKGYVKWDLSSVTEPTTNARLEVQGMHDSPALVQALDVYLLNDGDVGEGWNEGALTWNNAPASIITSSVDFDEARSTYLGQLPLSQPVRAGQLHTMLSQALIDAINNDTDGNLTLMFAIVNQGPTGLSFGTKEDTDGNPAQGWTVPFVEATLVLNDPADVLPPPDIPGDADLDRDVDDDDVAALAANWQTPSGATWAMGDFNDDGAVNDIDATLLATNWTGPLAAVPEPGTITLLLSVIGSVLLAFFRQKR